MKSVTRNVRDAAQKDFCRTFDSLCGRFSRWEIWSDFVVMSAIAISNTVDHTNAKVREEAYKKIASKYKSAELERFAEMLAAVVTGMDNNPDQDFLGELYMSCRWNWGTTTSASSSLLTMSAGAWLKLPIPTSKPASSVTAGYLSMIRLAELVRCW